MTNQEAHTHNSKSTHNLHPTKHPRKVANRLSSSFKNRTNELFLIRQTINDLQNGHTVQYPLINIHGVPGIGKSALLEKVAHEFNNQDVTGFYCNLEDLPREDLYETKLSFLKELAEGMAKFTHNFDVTVLSPPLNYDSDEEKREQAINIAIDQLAQYFIRQNQIILLIVDSWEYVQETLFAWFELRLLFPLISQARVFGLFGSQAQLRWRQFEVRRRVSPYLLQPLDTIATAEQVHVNETIAQQIYHLTFGHPSANETVRREIGDAGGNTAIIAVNQPAILETIVEEIIQRANKILQRNKDTSPYAFVEITTELRSILSVAALLRDFDVNTLRVMLQRIFPTFANRSQSALMLSIRQLAETRLIRWVEASRSYQIDPTLRHIFAREVEINHPDWYTTIREAAAEFYRKLADDIPSRSDEYLIEYLYQSLCHLDWSNESRQKLLTEFASYLRRYPSTQVRAILEQDTEIQAALLQHELSIEVLLEGMPA